MCPTGTTLVLAVPYGHTSCMVENLLVFLGVFSLVMVVMSPGALPVWANVVIVTLFAAIIAVKAYELRRLRA